jgi:hypothetical protein
MGSTVALRAARQSMELVNETSLHSHITRAQLAYKDLLQAIVVVKGAFDVSRSGEARPSARQPPVFVDDTETPLGTLEAEVVPVKAWCDLAVLGHAHSPPPGAPVGSLTVSLRIGSFSRTVQVSGDRVWQRALGGLRPSPPAPFTKLPLTYDHAFGGVARQGGTEAPHQDNPFGKGYVLSRKDAAGTPLPNIEETDQLIASWDDRPMPAGLAPLPRIGLWRGHRGFEADLEKQTLRMRPEAFCFSHPRMNVPAYPEGEMVELSGASARGDWRARLPPFRYQVHVALGARSYRLPVVVDTVYLAPDEDRLVIVGRSAFIYQFVPARVRTVTVVAGPEQAAADRPTTIRALRAEPRADVPVEIEPSRVIDLPLEELTRQHPMTELVEELPLCPSG